MSKTIYRKEHLSLTGSIMVSTHNHNKHHYIDGHWIKGNGMTFNSVNPADSSTVWEGRVATEEEILAAYEAAKRAKAHWSQLDLASRVGRLQNYQKQIEMRSEQLAYLIAVETGKPLWEARTEVKSVIGKIDISIDAYHERTGEKQLNVPDATGHLRFKPHGIVVVLGPFNFPAHLSNGHIVPALLAGNTIIYKPSELTPSVAECMMQCWHDSGLPGGVLNLIQGDASTAQTILKQKIQGVFFTGSYQTGFKIHQQFADKPEVILALEMGGNNPLVIDNVKNIEAALYHTLISTMITAGQRCTCARRLFIANSAQGDAFLKGFIRLCQSIHIGSFDEKPEPFMGPVIQHSHALQHLTAQSHLQSIGGQSILDMRLLKENSGFLSPGIMDMTQVENPPDEEIFAPFVQVYRYDTFEQALDQANQTKYGLAAGIITDDKARYQQFYQSMDAGIINWNRPTTGAVSSMPFGGVGHSGNHRPSAYFAADYCAYPIAGLESSELKTPEKTLPGIKKYVL